ncbi:MAG: PadR family transcriptional regulator [Emergencia sp.]
MKEKSVSKRDPLENFEAQFKKATLPLMVLNLLSEREMYAYEIMQEALRRSDGRYKMPLLYTTLNKLQEQKLVIESRKTISDDNRVRVYYKITEEGRQHLNMLKSIYIELAETVKAIVYDKE